MKGFFEYVKRNPMLGVGLGILAGPDLIYHGRPLVYRSGERLQADHQYQPAAQRRSTPLAPNRRAATCWR